MAQPLISVLSNYISKLTKIFKIRLCMCVERKDILIGTYVGSFGI